MCYRICVELTAVQHALTAYKKTSGHKGNGGELTIDLITALQRMARSFGDLPQQPNAETLKQGKRPPRYNGWSNRETWMVNLWLTNEEPPYRYWNEQAAEILAQASKRSEVVADRRDEAKAAKHELAEQLRDEVEQAGPTSEDSLYADLLMESIRKVDWHEIAESILSEFRE